MSAIKPIKPHEFQNMLARCTPPIGWSKNIAVAHSGGPDSTCLLFLLRDWVLNSRGSSTEQNNDELRPALTPPLAATQVVSLTVDHDLQASSASVAEHCTRNASGLGAHHVTAKIPWGTLPFPHRPSNGDAFEGTARSARYHLIMQMMKQTEECNIVAFGHHADDQVETALMRIGKGSSEIGAGGMRPIRRWGMGVGKGPGDLAWAGHDGMNRWIIRPLLGVSKDRILATCDEHGLEYITDETNFQPGITVRNALRRIINSPNEKLELPSHIQEEVDQVEQALGNLDSVDISLSSGPHLLRGAVQQLTSQVDDIEDEVDSRLRSCVLPSPPGTCLLSSRSLGSIQDPLIRFSMIIRVLRYASPFPWGSTRADAKRKRTSIQQIEEKLWNPNPFSLGIPIFVAGGGVAWTPVVVRNGQVKTPDQVKDFGLGPGDTIGWLASRQPPLKKRLSPEQGQDDPTHLDVTELLASQLQNETTGDTYDVLYDCRFLIRFHLGRIPNELRTKLGQDRTPNRRIQVRPYTRWFWPEVVEVEGEGDSETTSTLHSALPGYDKGSSLDGHHKVKQLNKKYWKPSEPLIHSDWVTIEWVRPLYSP